MKMKKTFLASVTAVALAAAMVPAVALAADNHETTVNYTVDEGYTWTVPAEVTFEKNATTDTQTPSDKVTVSNNVIPAGKSTQIALGSSNTFTVVSGAATRSFTVGKDASSTLKAGDPVLTVASGTASSEQPLTFNLLAPAGALQAGTYAGTVTFTAALI